jgi:hypothetical protein
MALCQVVCSYFVLIEARVNQFARELLASTKDPSRLVDKTVTVFFNFLPRRSRHVIIIALGKAGDPSPSPSAIAKRPFGAMRLLRLAMTVSATNFRNT